MIRQPRTTDAIQNEMLAELPDGWASSHSPDDYLGARFRPQADAFAQIEASALSMLPEIDPRSAPHILPDFERMLGPDPCQVAAGVTDVDTRGRIAFARLTNAGTICAGYFERFALTIGETITIDEFPASQCGDPATGGSQCGDYLNPPPNHSAFRVNLHASHVVTAICGLTQCGESLGTFTGSVMECVISNQAPLYATAYFSYT